jgi:hypothetical protein
MLQLPLSLASVRLPYSLSGFGLFESSGVLYVYVEPFCLFLHRLRKYL